LYDVFMPQVSEHGVTWGRGDDGGNLHGFIITDKNWFRLD